MSLSKKQLKIASDIFMNMKSKDITLEQVIEALKKFSWNVEGMKRTYLKQQRILAKKEKQAVKKVKEPVVKEIKFVPGHILFIKESHVGINYEGAADKGYRPFIVLFVKKEKSFLVALTSNLNSHIPIKHWNEESEKYRTSFMNIENNYLWNNSKIIAHIRDGSVIASPYPAETDIDKLKSVFLSINNKLNYLFKENKEEKK